MSHSKILIVVVVMVVLPLAGSLVAHGEQVMLDGDLPSVSITTMKPGDYAKFQLPWDVTFSSIHGDDENKDSELVVAGVDIRVHLGNDNVLLTITDDGEKEYEEELAHQPGFCWSCGSKGHVDVELIFTCTGNLKIYVNNQQVYSKSGLDTATALQVDGDKDVQFIDQGTYYTCGTPPPDYKTGLSRNNKLLIAGIATASILGLFGLAMATSRG